ncbi:unnamed protein product [Pleuronectes platessa]|uniref:Uncharacterized protein n=1 Tax=Pleuronectes platessa TaxID=8262 RepID=A0A9N7YXH8_PLEPL|nr:unnamed protein product [Pleuronectes platessa]
MRTLPAFLGTTTIPAHQSVGSSILVITPIFSIRSISSLTFPISGRGTLRGVWREKGTASGFNLIAYGLRTRPKPLHNFRYRCFTESMDREHIATWPNQWVCRHCQTPHIMPPCKVMVHLGWQGVTSSQCCERLENERGELRLCLEEALKRLEEQHNEELALLEVRLRSFYQTEYQEEADKSCMLMKQQVKELRNQQETERKNLEVSQSQRMESVKKQYDTSIKAGKYAVVYV